MRRSAVMLAAYCLGLAGAAWAGQSEARKADDKFAADKIVGHWKLKSGKNDGNDVDAKHKESKYEFTKDRVIIDGKTPEGKDSKFVMSYKVDAEAKPATIDMEIVEGPEGAKGLKGRGIIALEKGLLKLAYRSEGDRPKEFESKADSKVHYFEFERVEKPGAAPNSTPPASIQ